MTTFLSNREIYEAVICGIVPQVREQFDSVWRGAFCRDCGRREHCPDPVV